MVLQEVSLLVYQSNVPSTGKHKSLALSLVPVQYETKGNDLIIKP